MLVGKKLKQADYYAFIVLDENAERHFELIDGEIVEKLPNFGYTSGTSAMINGLFFVYRVQNPIFFLTDAQGGYELDDENTFMPDVGIILKARLAALPTDSYIPMRPDIAVEVVSKSDLEKPKERIEKKLKAYQAAGVPFTLYVYPERRAVEVYRPGQPMQVVGVAGEIDLSAVLPGFILRVQDIFPA
jgi:Uma2 family endonuclease